MGRNYGLELERIKETIDFACEIDLGPLETTIAELVSRNMVFVGSGGSFTAAMFAAALHEEFTGRMAKALTPLEAVRRPDTTNTVAVLLSARGSNPDILKAFKSLNLRGPVVGICASENNALLRLMDQNGFGFSVPGGRDGFLATNSLLATLIVLVRGYRAVLGIRELNSVRISNPNLGCQSDLETSADLRGVAAADTIIALSSGWGWPAAIDFESKCSESGLSNVMLADYRNFAHGRHNWIRRKGDTTAVVSIEDPANTELASSILRLLPEDVKRVRLTSKRNGPDATIELVAKVLQLIGALGVSAGVDPGRPPVPEFGRRMYRNGFPMSKRPGARQVWISKKAEAIGLTPNDDSEFVAEALDQFLERLNGAAIRAIVADYDGTLCSPMERFTGLSDVTARSLSELLSRGLTLAVATGRGESAHRDLRRAIPSHHWSDVLLGLYNGGMKLLLSDPFPHSLKTHEPEQDAAYDVLTKTLGVLPVRLSWNPYQLSVIPTKPLNLENLRRSIVESLDQIVPANLIHQSAHSVDVLRTFVTKAAIPAEVEHRTGIPDEAILRIGDLGEWGGNDYELLNNGLSLSVDRVSSRLDSCWNLGSPGSRGAVAALEYLMALQPIDEGFRFRLRQQHEKIRNSRK